MSRGPTRRHGHRGPAADWGRDGRLIRYIECYIDCYIKR